MLELFCLMAEIKESWFAATLVSLLFLDFGLIAKLLFYTIDSYYPGTVPSTAEGVGAAMLVLVSSATFLPEGFDFSPNVFKIFCF